MVKEVSGLEYKNEENKIAEIVVAFIPLLLARGDSRNLCLFGQSQINDEQSAASLAESRGLSCFCIQEGRARPSVAVDNLLRALLRVVLRASTLIFRIVRYSVYLGQL